MSRPVASPGGGRRRAGLYTPPATAGAGRRTGRRAASVSRATMAPRSRRGGARHRAPPTHPRGVRSATSPPTSSRSCSCASTTPATPRVRRPSRRVRRRRGPRRRGARNRSAWRSRSRATASRCCAGSAGRRRSRGAHRRRSPPGANSSLALHEQQLYSWGGHEDEPEFWRTSASAGPTSHRVAAARRRPVLRAELVLRARAARPQRWRAVNGVGLRRGDFGGSAPVEKRRWCVRRGCRRWAFASCRRRRRRALASSDRRGQGARLRRQRLRPARARRQGRRHRTPAAHCTADAAVCTGRVAGRRVVALSAGGECSAAVDEAGALWSWGYNAGQLGHEMNPRAGADARGGAGKPPRPQRGRRRAAHADRDIRGRALRVRIELLGAARHHRGVPFFRREVP